MRFKTPLILFAVLLVLALVATWDDWRTEKKAEEEKSSKQLTSLKLEDIKKITFYDAGGNADGNTDETEQESDPPQASPHESKIKEIKIEKIDDKWRITAPLETNANSEEVEDFIKTVLDYQYDRLISDASDQRVDLAEYGLDKPRRTITLTGSMFVNKGDKGNQSANDSAKDKDQGNADNSSQSTSFTIRIGNKSPVGYSAYFNTADNRVYVGSQYIITSTAKSLFSFRDKQLIAIDSDTIKNLSFWHKDKQQSYSVVRKDGLFQLQKPEAFKTSQKKVREFIDEFNRVRVEKFFDAPDAELKDKFTSAKSLTMTTVFELSTGETKSLSFVRDRGDLLVAFDADKAVFKLPAVFEETVNNLSSNFRDHSIFSFNSADVEQVKVDGEVYRLVEGRWYRHADVDDRGDDNPDGELSNTEAKANDNIQTLLDEWETVEALGFLDDDEADAIAAKGVAHKIELTISTQAQRGNTAEQGSDKTKTKDKTNKQLEVLIWQQNDKYYLKHDDSDQFFRVAKSIVDPIASPITNMGTSILTNE